MTPSLLSSIFIGAFGAAVLCLGLWQRHSYPWWLWVVLGGIGCLVLALCRRSLDLQRLAHGMIAVLLGVSAALAVVMAATPEITLNRVEHFVPRTVTIRGIVRDDPLPSLFSNGYRVDVTRITASGATTEASGTVWMTDSQKWPLYAYGDEIEAQGALASPTPSMKFLDRLGIRATLKARRIDRIAQGQGNPIISVLFAIRHGFEHHLNLLLPEPHASLAAGLTTGSRGSIPQDLIEAFQSAGLSHIIAISGFNITIVIAIIGSLLFWLPLKWRFVPAVIAISAFTLLVGASASAVRAAIMGVLGLLAIQSGRQRDIRLAILWTFFFMLAYNPRFLWNDAGFQLSFLAVIGMAELTPILTRTFARLPEWYGLRTALTATLAAEIMTLPFAFLLFGTLPLSAPVTNLLVAPMIPVAMFLSALCAAGGWILLPFGRIIGWAASVPLLWIVTVARTAAAIPFLTVTASASPWIIGAFYAGLIWIIVAKRKPHIATQNSPTPSNRNS